MSEETVYTALAKAFAEMKPVVKDADNPYFKSKYADYAAIDKVIRPVLSAHGLFVSQATTIVEGAEFLQTHICHTSGTSITSAVPLVYSREDGPQKAGSALTYARRYGLSAALGLAVVDEDDDDGETAQGSYRKPQKSRQAPGKPGYTFLTAKYDGFCKLCNHPINAGEHEIAMRTDSGAVAHKACYEKKAAGNDVPVDN